MNRLLVGLYIIVIIQNSLLFSATEYHLESPLWKYVIIHLHNGDYEGLARKGEDQHFHLSVPYMYDEKELIPFLNSNLTQLQHLYNSKDIVKKISQFPVLQSNLFVNVYSVVAQLPHYPPKVVIHLYPIVSSILQLESGY